MVCPGPLSCVSVLRSQRRLMRFRTPDAGSGPVASAFASPRGAPQRLRALREVPRTVPGRLRNPARPAQGAAWLTATKDPGRAVTA